MGLFKEINCACCGKKTSMLKRTRLKDDQYVCSDCTANVPGYIKDNFGKLYDYERFVKLKEYIEYSGRHMGIRFHETNKYETLHLDSNSGYLYFDHGFSSKPLYLNVKEVDTLELVFEPETYKEGVFTEKVKGNVKMLISVVNPPFVHTEVIKYGAKADARKKIGLFKDKVQYENPKGMDEFMEAFLQAKTEVLLKESEDILRQVNDALR